MASKNRGFLDFILEITGTIQYNVMNYRFSGLAGGEGSGECLYTKKCGFI